MVVINLKLLHKKLKCREGKILIVVSNRIQVAKGHEKEFEERFQGRAGLVDKISGFIRLEILKPIKSDYYVVHTYWENADAFHA
jgi:heme-degrading monooxygenase HmoA